MLNIDPITRIEGHLAIRVEIESGRVVKAFCSGEMFRGFEVILKGRDPLDAQQITQRICGVCPVSHGIASSLAQDMAYKISPPDNGRLIRNIILGANYIQSHIMHFYHLSAPDFLDIAAITEYQGKDPLLQEFKAYISSRTNSNLLFPAAPFLPRYDSQYIPDTEVNISGIRHYLDALEMRALAHKMGAIFGGKLPHAATLLPGGVTEKVTSKSIGACKSMLKRLRTFIEYAYLPDVKAVGEAFQEYFQSGRGCGNFMAYGVFPESLDRSSLFLSSGVIIDGTPGYFDEHQITEDVTHAFYSSVSGPRPTQGKTVPEPDKYGAYSWIKAPRYQGKVMEVGPLARIIIAYTKGDPPEVRSLINMFLDKAGKTKPSEKASDQETDNKPQPEKNKEQTGSELIGRLNSVMGRHLARAIECKIVADRCEAWIDQLKPGEPTFNDFDIPETARGVGLTEAPRGALGHWLDIAEYKIRNYQCVVPTTWNCSPRDDRGISGTVEQALVGTPIADIKNPIEAARVVRSFDPCIACAVH